MLYLASQSPQRAMLLTRAGLRFTVVPSANDEEAIVNLPPPVLAAERARHKCRGAVLPAESSGVVLAADTLVVVAGKVLGKPVDRADAERMLGLLSGTTHTVITGHCCRKLGQEAVEAVGIALAKVTFRPLTQAQIAAYVATGECDGRAGAYAVQERGDQFVAEIQGGWDTVVGLTLATVTRLHRELTDSDLAKAGA
ncbi:Maf-like protein [Planctomycetota bacterium]|nr:Maf-like protein [Planctomycetota bacterium]